MKAWQRMAHLAAVLIVAACSRAPQPAAPVLAGEFVHANGVVEPAGEERLIVPQRTGRVERVLVDEGDAVAAGELLAELDNAAERAAVAAAQAQVALREAELQRMERGARGEEIRAARAAAAEAAAQSEQATAELARRRELAARKLLATESLDEARTRAAAAASRHDAAAAELALLLAGNRREDIDIARAALAAAQADRIGAEAELEKTRIRAPIDGVVLKRVLNAGETVTAFAPAALAAIGNMDRLMVRAEIDELDIARIADGAAATVRSDAFPGREFSGRVTRVARRMGARSILSDDPAERRDAKILEALIELDQGSELPVGLRVDVRIDARTE